MLMLLLLVQTRQLVFVFFGKSQQVRDLFLSRSFFLEPPVSSWFGRGQTCQDWGGGVWFTAVFGQVTAQISLFWEAKMH